MAHLLTDHCDVLYLAFRADAGLTQPPPAPLEPLVQDLIARSLLEARDGRLHLTEAGRDALETNLHKVSLNDPGFGDVLEAATMEGS